MLYSNLIEIFLISILPISLIKFKIIPSKFRLLILGGVFILLFILLFFQDIPVIELGFRTDNFNYGMVAYLNTTIIAILVLIALAKLLKNKYAEKWHEDPHFLFLFIPISFVQQFLFQGFILLKLQLIFSPAIAVIITAIIFGYMHTIFPKPLLSMLLGTLAGLLFATLYTFYPNIFVASITHALLNFTAVYLGFFTFFDPDGIPKKTELNLT